MPNYVLDFLVLTFLKDRSTAKKYKVLAGCFTLQRWQLDGRDVSLLRDNLFHEWSILKGVVPKLWAKDSSLFNYQWIDELVKILLIWHAHAFSVLVGDADDPLFFKFISWENMIYVKTVKLLLAITAHDGSAITNRGAKTDIVHQ